MKLHLPTHYTLYPPVVQAARCFKIFAVVRFALTLWLFWLFKNAWQRVSYHTLHRFIWVARNLYPRCPTCHPRCTVSIELSTCLLSKLFPSLYKNERCCARSLGWDRFSLVGHSMGGGVASLVAASFPELVERCVFIDILGPYSFTQATSPRRLRASVESRRKCGPQWGVVQWSHCFFVWLWRKFLGSSVLTFWLWLLCGMKRVHHFLKLQRYYQHLEHFLFKLEQDDEFAGCTTYSDGLFLKYLKLKA